MADSKKPLLGSPARRSDLGELAFLARLPPEFVNGLPLDAIEGAPLLVQVVGRMYLACGGDPDAIKEYLSNGGTYEELEKTKKEDSRSDQEWIKEGRYFLEHVNDLSKGLLRDLIIRDAEKYCSQAIGETVSNKAMFPSLPFDLLELLDAATECFTATLSLTMFSATAGLRAESWDSSPLIAVALEKLVKSKDKLQHYVDAITVELAAAQTSEISVGETHYLSAHHAIFGMAETTLNTIDFARTGVGRTVFIENIGLGGASDEAVTDCIPIAAGLLKLPTSDMTPLLAKAQQEACRIAANRRASTTVNTMPTDREDTILQAIGIENVTGPKIAKKAGFSYNSHFRDILSQMVKRGLIKKLPGRLGYSRGN